MFNRGSLRLRGYDYSQNGAYFVTICTNESKCLFGHVVDGSMRLNQLGLLVEQEWCKTAQVRSNVELDYFVVMPNHLHGILLLSDAAVKVGPTYRTAHADTLQANSIGAIISQFKSIVTKRSRKLSKPPTSQIWQRNYYDHIIRNERSFTAIRSYILANAAKWRDDEYYQG